MTGDPLTARRRKKRHVLAESEGMAAVAELPPLVPPPPHMLPFALILESPVPSIA